MTMTLAFPEDYYSGNVFMTFKGKKLAQVPVKILEISSIIVIVISIYFKRSSK